MHESYLIILSALFILLFGLFSKKTEHFLISAPMFFVSVGMLFSPLGLNLFSMEFNADVVIKVAELTLIMILFTDASQIKLSHLRHHVASIPTRLLLIGLPLTMLLGSAIGYLFFPQHNLWTLMLLGFILSPTDAALGQAVVQSKNVPESVRDSISIESGLNDGITLAPILVCAAVIASGEMNKSFDGQWLEYMALQLTIGPILGALVGFYGGKMVDWASNKDFMLPIYQRLSAFSIAILAYALAESFHGNGFIAAFVAGLVLGIKTIEVRGRLQEFAEAEGQILSSSIFLMLGLVAIPYAFSYWQWSTLIYACLSLTIIRWLPVFISLIGTRLSLYSKFFIAWFGPRGIASFLYLLIVAKEMGLNGYEDIFSTIILTILLSIFLHGITATPMSKLFNKKK